LNFEKQRTSNFKILKEIKIAKNLVLIFTFLKLVIGRTSNSSFQKIQKIGNFMKELATNQQLKVGFVP
jgi:hypothetical protein